MFWLQKRIEKRWFASFLLLAGSLSVFSLCAMRRVGKDKNWGSALRAAGAVARSQNGVWPGMPSPVLMRQMRQERYGLARELSMTKHQLDGARSTLNGIKGLTVEQRRALANILAQLDREKAANSTLQTQLVELRSRASAASDAQESESGAEDSVRIERAVSADSFLYMPRKKACQAGDLRPRADSRANRDAIVACDSREQAARASAPARVVVAPGSQNSLMAVPVSELQASSEKKPLWMWSIIAALGGIGAGSYATYKLMHHTAHQEDR